MKLGKGRGQVATPSLQRAVGAGRGKGGRNGGGQKKPQVSEKKNEVAPSPWWKKNKVGNNKSHRRERNKKRGGLDGSRGGSRDSREETMSFTKRGKQQLE